MLARDILHEADGRLVLGAEGEKQYGRRNFFELYAVFDAPDVLRVVHGGQEVGAVQGRFIHAISGREGGGGCFRLGGRSWQVVEVQWSRGICRVVPAESGRVPNWLGTPSMLSQAVCAEIRRVLADDSVPSWLTAAATAELGQLRDAYDGLVGDGDAPLESDGETLRWHTFAGGAINRLLALGLEQTGAGEWVAGNWSLKPKRRQSLAEATAGVAGLARVDWTDLAAAQADDEQYAAISKFQRCLPPELVAHLVATRVFNAAGTAAFLAAHRVTSTRALP
jgi:ATP-dependent Lhr-like helicase